MKYSILNNKPKKSKSYLEMGTSELFAYGMSWDNWISALCRSSVPDKKVYEEMNKAKKVQERIQEHYKIKRMKEIK